MIKLIITDLDDTLYSWIGFYIPAFYEMAEELSSLLGVPVDKIIGEFQEIHRKAGSVEPQIPKASALRVIARSFNSRMANSARY